MYNSANHTNDTNTKAKKFPQILGYFLQVHPANASIYLHLIFNPVFIMKEVQLFIEYYLPKLVFIILCYLAFAGVKLFLRLVN